MKLKTYMPLLALILQLLLFAASCKQSTEPKLETELKLELEDASCTEVWIKLTTTNLQLPTSVTLKQDGVARKTINVQTQDTVLYIDSLLPNKTYKFQTFIQSYNHSSNELSVTTMDTTSHEFTWQSWEFGSMIYVSRLFDVSIIDENDIWTVGEINIADTSINGYTTYNAVHWDGTKWELKKIGGQGGWACHTVFAFSTNNIWFEGNIHWNGFTYTAHMNGWPLMPNGDGWQVNKMWGSSSEDLYAVGNNGNIAHWDGSKWRKIESGTYLNLTDITPGKGNDIYICGWDASSIKGLILRSTDRVRFNYYIEGGPINPEQLFNPKLFGEIATVWHNKNKTLYAGGSFLYQNKFNKWDYVKSLPNNYLGGNPNGYFRGFIGRIKGNASNDFWIIGDRNTLRHFNGVRWEQIGWPYNPDIDLMWRGIDCKENITVVVGSYNREAIVMLIRR